MPTQGTIEAFSGKAWASWIERLGFFVANSITSLDKKRALLLTLCGPETYDIVRAFVAPRTPGDIGFEELVSILGTHFDPQASELYSGYKFQRRDQLADESINSYVATLKQLAADCNFSIPLTSSITAATTASQLSTAELFFSLERLYREHRDAFELPEEIFRKQYRLPKIVVRWLCDELREEPEVRRVRTSWTVMTVELQVLCALPFYGTGSFQGMVASDEHVARDQKTVSVAVRAVSVAIVRRLGVQRGWIHFPETPSERFDAEKGFRLLGRIPGVIGCVDGTMVSIVGPSKNDPTVTKAAYWCRKYFYALNVMVVCDADCRIMCIDPRYPGSVHDSFVWQFSWLRNQLEQGQLPRDGRFLLGDSGYPLEPWLITPVPGNHATSTACGRFNKAHSSISAPQHLPCIERARTGVRLRP
ncbi:putative nuclease HARBI1 isoform X1 [Ixodes scapularis]